MRIAAAPNIARTRVDLPAPAAAAGPSFPTIPGVEHHFATVKGVRYHYVEAGRSDAPPLVLIHGFPQNWYMWRELIPTLAKHFRVIAPDMRGSGWSQAPSGPYRKADIADEIAALMDQVGAPRARVMGHDWGGFVGFQLALRHPGKVEQYVALDIATPWPNPAAWKDAWRLAYQPVIAAPVLGPALLGSHLFIKSMLWAASKVRPWSDADVAAFSAPYRDAAHAAAGSMMYRTFLKEEIVPWARGDLRSMRLEPQTLLLVGEHDLVIRPRLIEGYERYSRDMRHEFVPGAGHFLPEENPAAVLARVLPFFGVGGVRDAWSNGRAAGSGELPRVGHGTGLQADQMKRRAP